MLYTYDFIQRVQYVDTDQMGVMHNSNYFRFFEIGRNESMRNLGVMYKEVEQRGMMMPMVEQKCKYILPAYYDDLIIIRTSIDELPKAKFIFNYKLIRIEENNKEIEIAFGYNILAFIDKDTRRPRRCPEWILDILEKKLGN